MFARGDTTTAAEAAPAWAPADEGISATVSGVGVSLAQKELGRDTSNWCLIRPTLTGKQIQAYLKIC